MLQRFDIGNRGIRTRIDYHTCITSEPTNQVCRSPQRSLPAFNGWYIILTEWTFFILSCVSLWVSLFAFMVLFNLLSSWSWDWTLLLSRVYCNTWFAYCSICTLIFLSLHLENKLKKQVRNVTDMKYGFVKVVVIILLSTRYDYVIPFSNFGYTKEPIHQVH